MRIAITGGTGFVGRHLARALVADRHQIVLVARSVDGRDPDTGGLPGVTFVAADTSDAGRLATAFAGCQAVAHCAGINREIGSQTYARVHVEGTRAVVAAARQAAVGKLALLSFLRARPKCGSAYHESKWAAEELVRGSGLDYTVLKAAMIYGAGDHMLDHLSHALYTFPVFPLIGRDQPVRPVAVEDVVTILRAGPGSGRLSRATVAVMGPETMRFGEVVKRVAQVTGRHPIMSRLPVSVHMAMAVLFERVMAVPLIARAQVRMLAEGMLEPLPAAAPLPEDLQPRVRLTADQIRRGLPQPGPFGARDLRIRLPWKNNERPHAGASSPR